MPCNQNPELPRVPKLAVPQSATPNKFASINVMHHKIEAKNLSFLTILELGDFMLKFGYIRDFVAKTVYEMYLFRRIAYLDAP